MEPMILLFCFIRFGIGISYLLILPFSECTWSEMKDFLTNGSRNKACSGPVETRRSSLRFRRVVHDGYNLLDHQAGQIAQSSRLLECQVLARRRLYITGSRIARCKTRRKYLCVFVAFACPIEHLLVGQ